MPLDISSWAYDFAVKKVELIDNRAKKFYVVTLGTRLLKSSRPFLKNFVKSRNKAIFWKIL